MWDDIDDATLTARLHENFAELERYAEVILQMTEGKTIDRDAGGFENAAVFQLSKVSRRRECATPRARNIVASPRRESPLPMPDMPQNAGMSGASPESASRAL